MSIDVVVGLQWGDEGKGKIIDVLSPQADFVIRYQGGNNAGHTVVVADEKFILQLLPSGVINCKEQCIIGPGVVVDLDVLAAEIDRISAQGKHVNVGVDYRAHLIMPYHIALDKLKEEAKGANKIGTTVRGIGPTYIDKLDRIGLRMGDLLLDENQLKEKVDYILREKNRELESFNHLPFSSEEILEYLLRAKERFSSVIVDTYAVVSQARKQGKNILLEGAQALMLDIDYGTYPYVTASSPSAGGACVGAGIAPKLINNVYGVIKAYTTRVGEGPMPTEQLNSVGEQIREKGHEFGTNTKRPRRCGWLDLVLVKYACEINGVNKLVITKLDVLDEFEEIKVGVAYRVKGVEQTTPPINFNQDVEVIYKTFPGWKTPTSGIKNFSELPVAAQEYLRFIQNYLEINLDLVSVGPERTQNIVVEHA